MALIVTSNYGPPARMLCLVESRTCPNSRQGFRSELKDGETFKTKFIGASEQDCQNWALEKQFQVDFIEQDFIVIADARSAKDGTVLVQIYMRELDAPIEFGEFGILPRERNIWYVFRVDHKDAVEVFISLRYGPIDSAYPTYFGRTAELTDERGIFDVTKATWYIQGKNRLVAQA